MSIIDNDRIDELKASFERYMKNSPPLSQFSKDNDSVDNDGDRNLSLIKKLAGEIRNGRDVPPKNWSKSNVRLGLI